MHASAPGESYPARSPWLFVPVLYFLQGVPVLVVQTMSTAMYSKMGISNAEIGLWTSLAAWPWTAKTLWAPLIDRTATKRTWIIASQLVMVLAFAGAAMSMRTPSFFTMSLVALFAMAFISATHDIAADGFYMLSMNQDRQAFFVGIRSACFRLGTIFVTGGLVVYAGHLEQSGAPPAVCWSMALGLGAIVYAIGALYNAFALPKSPLDPYREKPKPLLLAVRFAQVVVALVAVGLSWRLLQIVVMALWFAIGQRGPVFPPLFQFGEFFGLNYETQLGIALAACVLAWGSTVGLFRGIGMAPVLQEFFGRKGILAILAFIFFFRFGESMISKLSMPFLLDPREKGGLGVTTVDAGIIVGTYGVVALTLGGLIGGWLISKYGIRKCLWPMILALNVPNLFYVWVAANHPGLGYVRALVVVDQFGYGFGLSAYLVYLLFICQGSTRQTSLYAVATGLMALGAMLAGITSGYVYQAFLERNPATSYAGFFLAVCAFALPAVVTLFFLPMDRPDLKTAPVDLD